MMESQLKILSESLDKKAEILNEILRCSREQEEIFREEQADLERFDALVDQKDLLIDRLTRLDSGFEAMYDRLAEEIRGKKQQFAQQIREIQQKITVVTDLSVTVQALEKRNKKLVEDYFSRERANIKRGRASSKAVYGYYKNMSASQLNSSQFYDSKQ